MKKLIYVFVALFMLVMISGCGARQNTIRYNNGEEVTDTGTETSDTMTDETEDPEETDENNGESTTTNEEGEEDIISQETEDEAADKVDEPKMENTAIKTGKLAVTSFDSAHLKTNLSYNVVKGTVPSDTHKITINGYQLSKYVSGQTQWDYIASTRFSTLKDGLNNYVVKTFDSDGDQTDSMMFSIEYTAPSIPQSLPDVGGKGNIWLALLSALTVTGSYTLIRRKKYL